MYLEQPETRAPLGMDHVRTAMQNEPFATSDRTPDVALTSFDWIRLNYRCCSRPHVIGEQPLCFSEIAEGLEQWVRWMMMQSLFDLACEAAETMSFWH